MPAVPLAAQLYTVRDFTKTPADIAKTLRKIKQIGYDAIQASAMGLIDATEFAAMLKGEGLACCATHTSIDQMRNNPRQIIDDHLLWNCQFTAIGGYWSDDYNWPAFIEDFNAIATNFTGSGVRIGYHNHSHELARFNGKTALAQLREGLDPEVWFELDTYWLAHGGADPIQWIHSVAGRIPCVHLKDMGITPERKQFMAEIGEGNLNWPGILDACKAAGVQWYIVEQDDCNGRDPFASLSISFKNLRAMGM